MQHVLLTVKVCIKQAEPIAELQDCGISSGKVETVWKKQYAIRVGAVGVFEMECYFDSYLQWEAPW